MHRIELWFHKDGDGLTILDIPLWLYLFDAAWFSVFRGYSAWRGPMWYVSDWLLRKTSVTAEGGLAHKVIDIPLENACPVSYALWPESHLCWRDDCPYDDWENEGGSVSEYAD